MTFDEHMAECGAEDFGAVIAALSRIPIADTSHGFTARTVQRAMGEGKRPRLHFRPASPWRSIAAAAAVLVLGLSAVIYLRQPPRDTIISWLILHQERDGAWNPALMGGDAQCRSAVAVLSAEALARAAETDGAARMALEKALPQLAAGQSDAGAWAFRPGAADDAMLTASAVRALSTADHLGIPAARIPLRKAQRWLKFHSADRSRIFATWSGLAGRLYAAALPQTASFRQ